jgi:hypothetical protein
MKYLIAIILILTLFTGCSVKRYEPIWSGLEQHPIRPDICPKENIDQLFLIHYMPGDKAYFLTTQDQSKHQRCYDLYGGCAFYRLDKDVFSGPDAGCIDFGIQIDKETCIAKGGEWHNYNFIGFGRWCWWPIEE